MATIIGTDAANTLNGTAVDDLIYGFDPSGPGRTVTQIDAARITTGLSQPLFTTSAPDDPTRLFVVEKGGQVEIIDPATGARAATPFLDVTGQVATAGEQGLLGLAFHPGYATNGKAYVYLINTSGDTEVREYTRDAANPNRLDPASAKLVLTIDQPAQFNNHRGGWMSFGPDGQLYIATGDGGGTGDPLGNSQNTGNLLGKMLRIDVNGDAFPSDPNRNYAIPATNPFVGIAGADEIYAYGLRNPWRNGFDRATGALYIADVGQDAREEINLGALGANYGWNLYEGSAPFAGGSTAGLTFPIAEYEHSVGRSITGGYAYRGGESEGLHGQYIFADFVADKLFSLSGGAITDRTAQLLYPNGGTISAAVSFGEDAEGNLYLVDFDGEVFRVTPRLTSADRNDTISGGAGNDIILAGAGNDLVRGGDGDDRISGMAGDDTLEGGAGRDVLNGNAGNDILRGEAGDDVLLGGAGDDILNGAAGADRLFGGAGTDMASYWGSTAAVTIDLGAGTAAGGDAAGDRLDGIEVLRGSRFADRLTGDAGANRLEGWEAADILAGGGGADVFAYLRLVEGGDRIIDFSRVQGDRIDVSAIDAGAAAGNQAFAFGGAAFVGGGVGSVRVTITGADTIVQADTGDGVADFTITLTGVIALTAADFIL
jgi:glucose/arabinose dehydrogenase